MRGTFCGLCGKQGPLKTTECCNRFVCAPFSNHNKATGLESCSRNHSEYSLCGLHHKLGHDIACDWRECSKCKDQLQFLERYVGYGTNRYNFAEEWEFPPAFETTRCAQCNELLKLNMEGFIVKADGHCICQKHQEIPPALARRLLSSGNLKVESFGIS